MGGRVLLQEGYSVQEEVPLLPSAGAILSWHRAGCLCWGAAGASAAGSSALGAAVEQRSPEDMLWLCAFLATLPCLSFPRSGFYWAGGGALLCPSLLSWAVVVAW